LNHSSLGQQVRRHAVQQGEQRLRGQGTIRTPLARAAASADLSDPAKCQSVAAGWDLFKRELHLHHTAEDEIIWPVLRPRLAYSENALSVLDAMEEEHERIDPLLAAVDAAFTRHHGSAGVAGDTSDDRLV
jgi:iron-sulfur cluster repair protein YtfE (RIC family)